MPSRRPQWHLVQKDRGLLDDSTLLLICKLDPSDRSEMPLLVRGEIQGYRLAKQLLDLLNHFHVDPHDEDYAEIFAHWPPE
jgi:hypothetical protein